MICGIMGKLPGKYGRNMSIDIFNNFIKVNEYLLLVIPVSKVHGFRFGCTNWVLR